MSQATSEETGARFGIKRVCEAWELPRSSVYAHQAAAVRTTPPGKRGPKTLLSDDQLVSRIREVLAASPAVAPGTWRAAACGPFLPRSRDSQAWRIAVDAACAIGAGISDAGIAGIGAACALLGARLLTAFTMSASAAVSSDCTALRLIFASRSWARATARSGRSCASPASAVARRACAG